MYFSQRLQVPSLIHVIILAFECCQSSINRCIVQVVSIITWSVHLVIGQLRSHETNWRRVSDNNNISQLLRDSWPSLLYIESKYTTNCCQWKQLVDNCSYTYDWVAAWGHFPCTRPHQTCHLWKLALGLCDVQLGSDFNMSETLIQRVNWP